MRRRRSAASHAIAVVTLGTMLLAACTVATLCTLALLRIPAPSGLDELAKMLVTGALGLLASTSTRNEEAPTEVQVVNEATAPVFTEEAAP